MIINNIAEHKKKGIVPESFPGTLVITPNKIGNPFLHKDYRQYGEEGNVEFEYFIQYLLAELNPMRTKYKKLKTKSRLSECFTPSDEAFALMILDNELEVWDKQIERKNMEGLTGSKLRIKKKYCSGYSTKKRGWSELGEKYYNKLIGHIKEVRQTTVASENRYLKKFKCEAGLEGEPRAMESDEDEESEVNKFDAPIPDLDELENFDI